LIVKINNILNCWSRRTSKYWVCLRDWR